MAPQNAFIWSYRPLLRMGDRLCMRATATWAARAYRWWTAQRVQAVVAVGLLVVAVVALFR